MMSDADTIPGGVLARTKRNGGKGEGDWRDDFVGVEGALLGLSPNEQTTRLNAVVAKAEAQLQASSLTLVETLAQGDTAKILAGVAMYLFSLQGEGRAHAPADQQINQHHLELLQAIALRAPLPPPSKQRVSASVNTVLSALRQNAEAFQLRGLKTRLAQPATPDLAQAQEHVRADTQMVRGEYHAAQTDRYLRALCARIDTRFTAAYGVAATALPDLQAGLLALVEAKIQAWRQGASRVAREYKPQKAIKAYAAAFAPGQEAALRAEIDAFNVPPGLVRNFLVEKAHLLLDQVFEFDLSQFLALLPAGVDAARAKKILDAWSLGFGDLADQPFDHVHLANPVWTRPFIRMTDERYLWPSPGTQISFAIAMVETLIDAVPDLKTAYETARGKVLEAELARLVQSAFKGAQTYTSLKWTSDLDGRGYETDALVILDRTALIFEAKAGRVTPQARRGADKRLKSELAKLMAEPAQQSARLEEMLTRRREIHDLTSAEGPTRIDTRQIDQVIRYNITFNSLGLLAASWPDLVKAGLIPADTPYAPTMSAADLEVVCELLESPAEIVHYLRRRIEFEANATFLGDEYDLVAFYIASGFNIGPQEYGQTYLGLYGMSQTLDAYFSRVPEGHKRAPKPRQARTKLWKDMLASLAERRPGNWLEMSHRLLNIDHGPQATFEAALPQMRAKILASRQPNDVMVANMHNPTIARRNPAVFMVYKAQTRADRDYLIQRAGASFMDEIGADGCLVVAFDAQRGTGLHSEIGLMARAPDDPVRRGAATTPVSSEDGSKPA